MRSFLFFLLFFFYAGATFSQAWMQYLPATKSEKELTFYDYQDAFKEWCRVKEIDNEGYVVVDGTMQKAGGWKQFKRWEYEMGLYGNYNHATGEFIHSKEMNRVLDRLNEPAVSPDNISADWVNLGYTWSSYFGGYFGIGRLNTIAFHPTNPNMFWVGAPRGGIWVTTTHGNSWTPLSDNIAHIGVSAIGIPSDYETSQTIYIGTGDRSAFAGGGVGILKSTDGGNSWQATGLTLPLDNFFISRLLIHPANSQIQYAGTSGGLYYTTNGWQTYSVSSTDKIIDMEFHPEDPDILYYSTREVGDITYIKRSVDQGITWMTILQKTGLRTEIAVSPDEPEWIWAVVADLDGGSEGVYLSMDGGDYFTKKGSANFLAYDCLGLGFGGQGSYDLCIAVNPANANDVWIGGINLWNSTDAGFTWDIRTHWSQPCFGQTQVVHADQHWIEFQNNTGDFFICNDGGISYYDPQVFGGAFVDISYGLVINQLYQLSNSQQRSNEILMGLQDNSTVLWTGGDYSMFETGDGINALINPVNDNIQFYTGHSVGPVGTTDHWESSWIFLTPGDSTSSWHKEFRIDPSNPSTIYYGLTNLWKATNNGNNFNLLYDPPETSIIKNIAIAPSNPDVIIFASSENVYKTIDGGVTWNSILVNWPAGDTLANLTEILIKHDDPNTIWISRTGWNGNRVFISTNGGNSWTNISAGLPNAPIFDILQDNSQTEMPILYAGGFFGVYVKLGEQDWMPFNSGLPNISVNDLDIYYAGNKLRAATWGRGFWETDLFTPEPGVSGNWTGTYNTSWHDYRNWQFLEVPDGTQDVVIPAGTPYSPDIFTDQAICNSIIINTGAQLSITGKVLTLADSLVVNGTLRMTAPGSELEVDGLIRWKSGSTFTATSSLNNKIRVYGDWIVATGVNNLAIDSADVYFMGNSYGTIYNHGTGFGFGNLFILKSTGKSVIIDIQSTRDITIKKNLSVTSGASLTHNSQRNLKVYGNITANGNLYFQNGTCTLNGDDATIHLATPVSYFNHLEVFAQVGKSKILNSDILIGGNLILSYGQFDPAGYNIKLTGDLTRFMGTMATGSGRMIFRGSNRQTISGSSISLNILELAKPADTLWIKGTSLVNCQSYDWTAGTIAVTESGTLSALDLMDDGIYGSFYLNSANIIELTQDIGQYIDLNGIIRIENGTFRVNGGKGESYWPDNVDSEIHMSGGLLDFVHQGIYLTNGAGLVEDITGGVIRTTKGFKGLRNDFTPSGGYIELWLTGDADLSHGPGSAFYDVRINKESSSVSAISDLTFNYALAINTGTFNVNGRTVSVYGSFNNYGTLKMTLPASQLNAFGNVFWRAGSSSDITDGLISFNRNWSFESGTNALLTGNNTVKAIGSLAQTVYHKDPDACFAHFISEKTGQHLGLDVSSEHPMRVTGNLTINGSNQFNINSADLIVGGAFQTESMSITTLNGGAADLQNFILNGTLDIDAGSMLVHNSFSQAGGGQLIIDGGSFILDKPYSGDLFSFSGTTDLNGGFFEISYNGIQFGTGAIVNFNGGNLRIGGDFMATALNSFKPGSGTVELINTYGTNIEVYNGNYFHNLLINKTGENPCYLSYPLIIKGQLAIESGELDTYSEGMLIEDDLIIQNSGTLTAGASDIYIRGDWINNRGSAGFVEETSNVWLNHTQPAVIHSETFYNLILQSSTASGQYVGIAENSIINVLNEFVLSTGAILMNNNATLDVEGKLHIASGSGLNANPSATGTQINCYGHWWDYNTTRTSMQGFTCGQSTVSFKGAGDQQLIAYGGTSFNHLNLQKPSNALLVYNPVVVSGNLTLQSGSWSYGATGLSHVFFGDFNCLPGALWLDDQNEVSFDGVQAQTISNTSGNPLNFGNFRVDRQDFGNRSGQLTIDSDISCTAAIFVGGNISMADHQFDCAGDMIILPDASVEFLNSATIRMTNNKTINVNGGSLFIGGDAENQPLVTHMNTGYYKVYVHSGGQINAAHTTFEYLHTRGIEFAADGGVFGDQPFNYCTLKDGISNGSLLYMSSAFDITFHNVNFPENTWGGTYNVAKYENAGNVYMPGAIGAFAGPVFEYDPHTRVHWPSTGIWEGDVSSDWHDIHNWRYDFMEPVASTDVVIPPGAPYYPVLTLSKVVNSLTIGADASLNINAPSLTVNTWSDIRGALNMPNMNCLLNTDSLIWQSGSSANVVNKSRVNITGDVVIKRGSNLHMTSGEFKFTGSGESRLICHDTAQIFYLYNHKDAPYSLSLVGDTLARLTVAGIFENGTNATLKCPSSQEWVFGGWFRNILNGHFRCENGTIRLTAPSMNTAVFRVSPGDFFHNLIVETPLNLYYTTTYSDTLRVNGDLIINQNAGNTSSLTANNFKIMLMGDWINNKGTTGFIPGTSKLILPNSAPQSVQGNTIFYYVEAGSNSSGLASFYGNNTIDHRLDIVAPVEVLGTLNANIVHNEDGNSAIHIREGGYMQIATLIQGGLLHSHNGTLIVNDLDEDYIFGTYIIDYGLVELNQEEYYASHDLNGSITIYGGELRCTGGSGSSAWPVNIGGSYASLTMTGGLFNLPNHWIEIRNNSFTENISGGTIRVYSAFLCNAGVDTFTPTGGAVEIVSLDDAGVSIHSANSHFWDLIINNDNYGGATYPSSNFKVKNELKVLSGKFYTDGFEITVGP